MAGEAWQRVAQQHGALVALVNLVALVPLVALVTLVSRVAVALQRVRLVPVARMPWMHRVAVHALVPLVALMTMVALVPVVCLVKVARGHVQGHGHGTIVVAGRAVHHGGDQVVGAMGMRVTRL